MRSPGSDERDEPDVRAVGAVVREAMAGIRGGAGGGLALGRLVRDWEAVVGPELAGHTAPVALGKGQLTVGASGPEWAAQARFLASEIGRHANAVLGRAEVRAVRVTVRPEVRKPLGGSPSEGWMDRPGVPRRGVPGDTIESRSGPLGRDRRGRPPPEVR